MAEPDTTAPVAITQADREAAAKVYDMLGFGPCQHIIDGIEDDIGVVQAFAAHRRLAAHGAGEGLRRAFNTAWSEACCHLAPGTGLHTAERDEAWADFARSTPPTDAGSTTREGGEGVA